MLHGPTRRALMLGSTAAAAAGFLFRDAAAKVLEPGAAVPEVDSLKMTVVMDSNHDLFLGAQAPAAVKVTRARGAADYRKILHNQWGLSLHLETARGGENRRYLLDFGYTAEALGNNLDILGVDPAKIDALILSHGHFDHYGGLLGFLAAHREKLAPALRLYAGGEDNFCRRVSGPNPQGHFSEFGVLDRRELATRKVEVVKCEKPTLIEDHAFTTGAIERQGFERVLPNTRVVREIKDGLGCDLGHFTQAERSGQPVPDEHVHEHATCFLVKGRGLVVITSCGHAGIINTIRQAMAVARTGKLHALVGGFHLAVAREDYLRQSVAALKALDPDVVIPMHCSGINFVNAVREAMPERLALSSTGSGFAFGA
jgi:7,8-dihydropterin-6-yl-methyl-4-(beta-D-ribofuranosyl)aminobenzene 5'-phosphate synthase